MIFSQPHFPHYVQTLEYFGILLGLKLSWPRGVLDHWVTKCWTFSLDFWKKRWRPSRHENGNTSDLINDANTGTLGDNDHIVVFEIILTWQSKTLSKFHFNKLKIIPQSLVSQQRLARTKQVLLTANSRCRLFMGGFSAGWVISSFWETLQFKA